MAEEGTGEQGDGEEPSAADRIKAGAHDSVARLSEGRAVPATGGELTVRSVTAVAVFLVAFLAVYLVLWLLLGGLGLAFGWIAALAVAALAVKLYAERAAG